MNFTQYRRKRAKLEEAARQGFINEHDHKVLIRTLAAQLRADGQRKIETMRREYREGL